MEVHPTLAAADYVIIATVLTVSLGVGIVLAVQRRHKTSKEDYLLGNRKLHVLPVTLSMFVTFMSSTSLIGFPAEAYTTGSNIVFLSLGTGMALFVGIFTVIPIMHPLKVTSLYEYFQLRYQSSGLRLFVTCVGMCQKILYTAVVLLSPALSVQTGLPFWVSVVLVGAVGIIYTSIGGIRGVVLVDVFQAIIMMIGISAVLIKAVIDIGGLELAWSIAKDGGRIQSMDFDPDPLVHHSMWTATFGGMFTFFAMTFDQSAVQRVCSIPTMTGSRIVYAVNILFIGVFLASLCFMGVIAYSYFVTEGCDPFKSGIITNQNQLMPYFAMKIFKDLPGMMGLYLATIFSGALSTVSSMINGLAANTIEDILAYPLHRLNIRDSVRLLIAKLSVCFYGGLCIGLAFLASNLAGTVVQITIAMLGALGGPIVGIFFLGALFPRANKIGATVGLLVSLFFNVWLTTGAVLYGHKPAELPHVPGSACVAYDSSNPNATFSNSTTLLAVFTVGNETFSTMNPLSTAITTSISSNASVPNRTVYDISYQYYGLTGWLMSFIVGLLVSLITHKCCQPVLEERLYFPFVRKLWSLNRSYTPTNTEDENSKENEHGMVDVHT